MPYKYKPVQGETLRQKQSRFTWMLADLLGHARDIGYELTMGDAYRQGDKRCHGYRLAVDLNLFINGQYRTETEAHRELGMFWESLAHDARWGGHFEDGNHYSIEHNGHK